MAVNGVVELADLSVVELLEAFESKRASPSEAVESCLNRIASVDRDVNATLTVLPRHARDQAAESGERWQQGRARPLEGIPFGLKDIIHTAGIRTTGGSRLYEGHTPDRSATVAERLQDAGCVLVAKLQTFEFAAGPTSATGNPWDLERWAGGSSSGSAAAVAARELPFAIGTDTGGSIRIPAALCGVSGLKPTYGLVPRDGVMSLAWTLDHVGPIARTAADCGLVLSAISGSSPGDLTSSDRAPRDYAAELTRGVEGLRVGVITDWFFESCDPEVESATRAAIRQLEEAGAELVELSFPAATRFAFDAIAHTINAAEIASLHAATLSELRLYGPEFSRLLVRGQFVSAVDYLHALRARHLVQLEFGQFFQRVDALAVPTIGCTSPSAETVLAEIGEDAVPFLDVGSRNTAVFNVLGVPALTVPVGFDRRELPIGMQLVAPPHEDAVCLRLGHAYQERTDFHRRVPVLVHAGDGNEPIAWAEIVEKPVDVATSGSLW
jgi:aspartyl-tRNA(Asn)/glutamyl-tRNA(Gln) amidotransferase subunit A